MGKDLTKVRRTVFMCNGGSCTTKGAEDNIIALRDSIKANLPDEEIHTIRTKCCGQCSNGPIMFINPDGIWYKNITVDVSEKIVTEHLSFNNFLNEHIYIRKAMMLCVIT